LPNLEGLNNSLAQSPGVLWSCSLTQDTWISVMELLSDARNVKSTGLYGGILRRTHI